MRYCIFSDIHGNADALYQMMNAEEGNVDAYIFLGDIFGYFYDQVAIIDCLKEISNIYMIKGNHDAYYLNSMDNKSQNSIYRARYGASYDIVLSKEQQSFMRNLSEGLVINDDYNSIIHAYHGGPDNHLEQRIYPDTKIDSFFNGCNYLLVGHTHYQFVRKNEKYTLINPGSLGQPRDGKGFSYCLLDTRKGEINFRNVQPNIKELIKKVDIYDYNTINGIYLKKKYEGLK